MLTQQLKSSISVFARVLQLLDILYTLYSVNALLQSSTMSRLSKHATLNPKPSFRVAQNAEEADGGHVSGREVLEEDVRQFCLHEMTQEPMLQNLGALGNLLNWTISRLHAHTRTCTHSIPALYY